MIFGEFTQIICLLFIALTLVSQLSSAVTLQNLHVYNEVNKDIFFIFLKARYDVICVGSDIEHRPTNEPGLEHGLPRTDVEN